jgi:type IV secretory pathway VirB2 component (pilin)
MLVHRISLRRLPIASVAILTILILFPATALAAPIGGGGGMPWNSTFSKILDSIQELAPILATIAFLIAGIIWMFGEGGGMSRKAVGLVVGGAIVFGVAPLITTLFEGSAGLLF